MCSGTVLHAGDSGVCSEIVVCAVGQWCVWGAVCVKIQTFGLIYIS